MLEFRISIILRHHLVLEIVSVLPHIQPEERDALLAVSTLHQRCSRPGTLWVAAQGFEFQFLFLAEEVCNAYGRFFPDQLRVRLLTIVLVGGGDDNQLSIASDSQPSPTRAEAFSSGSRKLFLHLIHGPESD